MRIIRFLKNWTLPVSIAAGTALYLLFRFTPQLDAAGDALSPVFDVAFPLCIFLTLFVTFAKVNFRKMRPVRWHGWLMGAQVTLVAANVGVVLAVRDNEEQKILWESVLACVIGPCASAAPVVTGKLGGDINAMTTYTLLSSLLCALTIPAVFPMVEKVAHVTFAAAALLILRKLAVVLLLPLLLGWAVRHYVKPVHRYILRHPDLGFYTWGVALAITTGITVKNIMHAHTSPGLLPCIAAASFAVCVLHFAIGRAIGRRHGAQINCGQGMFQKNTSMAIWVSYMYLNPVASIGAGCYVLWQNIINSYEIWEQRAGKLKVKN